MLVLKAELVSPNKRERISGGVYIEFLSLDNVGKDDYFRIIKDNKSYDFQATDISVQDKLLRISAREVGYWATKLDNKGIDLRTIIECEVIPVTEDSEKKLIYEKSCWC